MKKLTLLFMMILFISGTSSAQIQIEPYHWDPFQKIYYPFAGLKKSPSEIGQMLTFEKQYSVVEIPEFSGRNYYFSKAGPLLIVKFDSQEHELADLANSNLDVNWIKKISVLKDKAAEAKYGSRGKNGVVIIELKKDHSAKIYRLKNGRIVEFSNHIKECEPPYQRKFVQ